MLRQRIHTGHDTFLPIGSYDAIQRIIREESRPGLLGLGLFAVLQIAKKELILLLPKQEIEELAIRSTQDRPKLLQKLQGRKRQFPIFHSDVGQTGYSGVIFGHDLEKHFYQLGAQETLEEIDELFLTEFYLV